MWIKAQMYSNVYNRGIKGDLQAVSSLNWGSFIIGCAVQYTLIVECYLLLYSLLLI